MAIPVFSNVPFRHETRSSWTDLLKVVRIPSLGSTAEILPTAPAQSGWARIARVNIPVPEPILQKAYHHTQQQKHRENRGSYSTMSREPEAATTSWRISWRMNLRASEGYDGRALQEKRGEQFHKRTYFQLTYRRARLSRRRSLFVRRYEHCRRGP